MQTARRRIQKDNTKLGFTIKFGVCMTCYSNITELCEVIVRN
jgi:hypothetical protein